MKRNNKILFTLMILVLFILFMFITSGLGGIIKGWNGLLHPLSDLFKKIYQNTYYGSNFITEVLWIILLIPVLIIFKKRYIFSKPKESFKSTILKSWPLTIFMLLMLIRGLVVVVHNNVDILEIVSLTLFCIAIGTFEELLCRGWLLNEFIEKFGSDRKNVILSIIVSSLIFGVIHIINFFGGQPLIATIAQIIGALTMGITLGVIYFRSKNIKTVIFIHGFWDFTIFLQQLNIATSCISASGKVEYASILLALFYLFSVILQEIPGIATAFLFLRKRELNEALPKNEQKEFNAQEIKEDNSTKKVISICMTIFLIIWGIITLSTIWNPELSENKTCPKYIEKIVNNYSETYNHNTSYEILVSTIEETCPKNMECYNISSPKIINFSINNNKLEITDSKTTTILNYENVKDLVVIENSSTYSVFITSLNDSDNYVVYGIHQINKTGPDNNIDILKEKFKQILLPSIKTIGYFEENNYKYPLFISTENNKYILDENKTIYQLKTE